LAILGSPDELGDSVQSPSIAESHFFAKSNLLINTQIA